jgi:hypothetical protein
VLSMLAIHAAPCGSTGKAEMLVFHTLSAGNIGQFGAPGRGDPADAACGSTTEAAKVTPPDAIPAIRQVASSPFVSLLLRVRPCVSRRPTVVQRAAQGDDEGLGTWGDEGGDEGGDNARRVRDYVRP